ncbi:hypothetical protein VTK56DRAFT_5982 [Thermocarpiscus australiensis]
MTSEDVLEPGAAQSASRQPPPARQEAPLLQREAEEEDIPDDGDSAIASDRLPLHRFDRVPRFQENSLAEVGPEDLEGRKREGGDAVPVFEGQAGEEEEEDLGNVGDQEAEEEVAKTGAAICAKVDAYRRALNEQLATGKPYTKRALQCSLGIAGDPSLHIIQPLSRGLLIAAPGFPVLVRTGVEDGLSAPISFEPIADNVDGYAGDTQRAVRTTLETAIGFVTDLEAREAAAFRPQPDLAFSLDPAAYTNGDIFVGRGDHQWQAEPFAGPSAQWEARWRDRLAGSGRKEEASG